jgi:hypothetical protein
MSGHSWQQPGPAIVSHVQRKPIITQTSSQHHISRQLPLPDDTIPTTLPFIHPLHYNLGRPLFHLHLKVSNNLLSLEQTLSNSTIYQTAMGNSWSMALWNIWDWSISTTRLVKPRLRCQSWRIRNMCLSTNYPILTITKQNTCKWTVSLDKESVFFETEATLLYII